MITKTVIKDYVSKRCPYLASLELEDKTLVQLLEKSAANREKYQELILEAQEEGDTSEEGGEKDLIFDLPQVLRDYPHLKNKIKYFDKHQKTNKVEELIEKYKLVQFIVAKQSEETREFAKKLGLKMIADRQVAFSDRDCWAYQSLFLEGWSLGCPPDYFSKDGQAWDFSVVDPEKLFNKDGSLGPAGELVKKLYLKMFKENPGGVRIDHTVGLIDPWVYKKGHKPKVEEGAGRLYSSPEHKDLNKYSIATSEDTDSEYKPDEFDPEIIEVINMLI